MARRRLWIAPGIYRERRCLIGVVRVGSQRTGELTEREKFAFGTDVRTIQAWQLRTRAQLLETLPQAPHDGTLAADAAAFLDTLNTSRRKDDFGFLLQHWIASPVGAIDRRDIQRTDILAQRSRWLETGVAVVSVNHRLRALRTLYHTLDGLDAPHPTDKITYLRPPRRENRAIPIAYVEQILAELTGRGRAERFGTRPTHSETKIRLRVIAWTGMPPVQLERLRPRDVDLKAGRITLHPRQKGKGAPAVTLDLLPAAIDAFTDYARAGLWGKRYSRSSASKAWKGAIRRVLNRLQAEGVKTQDFTAFEQFRDAIPPGCRPYDLRHSFLTEAYRITGDVRAVAELGQHANLETTKLYTEGAVTERTASAIAKMKAIHPRRHPPLRIVPTTT